MGDKYTLANMTIVDGDVTADNVGGVALGDGTFNMYENLFYSATALDVKGVEVSNESIYKVSSGEADKILSYNE